MTEGASDPRVGNEPVQEVEIRSANRGTCDPEQNVVRVLELRLVLLRHLYALRSSIGKCEHSDSPGWGDGFARCLQGSRQESRAARRGDAHAPCTRLRHG